MVRIEDIARAAVDGEALQVRSLVQDWLTEPIRLAEVPPISYVGRTAEREQLARLIEDAAGGRRRVALLSGEPGIGKTRLATHTALDAHAVPAQFRKTGDAPHIGGDGPVLLQQLGSREHFAQDGA